MAYSGVLSLRTIIESTLAKAGGHLSESTLAKAAAEASGVSLATVQREIRQMVDYGQLWYRDRGLGRTIYALGSLPPATKVQQKASSLAMDGPGSMDTVGQREAFNRKAKAKIRDAIMQAIDECGHKGEGALALSVSKDLGIGVLSVAEEVMALVQSGQLHRKKAGIGYTVWPSYLGEPKRGREAKTWVQATTPDTPPETTPVEASSLPQGGMVSPVALGTPPEQERVEDGQGVTYGRMSEAQLAEILDDVRHRWDEDLSPFLLTQPRPLADLELTPSERFKIQFLKLIEEQGIEASEAVAPIGLPWDAPGPLLYRVGVALGLLDGSLVATKEGAHE